MLGVGLLTIEDMKKMGFQPRERRSIEEIRGGIRIVITPLSDGKYTMLESTFLALYLTICTGGVCREEERKPEPAAICRLRAKAEADLAREANPAALIIALCGKQRTI